MDGEGAASVNSGTEGGKQRPETQTSPVSVSLIFLCLLVVIAGLVLMHIGTNLCWTRVTCPEEDGFFWNYGRWFDLNQEQNIPTWFSVSQLLLVAVASAVAALNAPRG